MTTHEIKIEGMSCNHCVMAIQRELAKTGINSFDVQIGSAKVSYDETTIKLDQIEKAIEEAGYKVRRD